jgi:hypothetical protein
MIPSRAHKYCGDCYAKGTIKATASPLNSSEIEGLRQILEERFGVEREEMTMKRVLIGVSDQPWPCANCEHEDYWDITGRRDRPMAFCRHCTYGNYASGFGFGIDLMDPEGNRL